MVPGENELVAIKNQLHSSQQKIFDSLQTCSDLDSHPKLQTLQKVNGWTKLSKRTTEWVYLVFSHNPSGYTSKTLKIQRRLLWKVCKHQTLKGSRLHENTILMQHNLPLRFGGLFLRKFIKDKQEVWKRWWASGGLRGRRQASRLFIGSGDMITSKSSQHFVGVCGPCAIKSHNKLEGN